MIGTYVVIINFNWQQRVKKKKGVAKRIKSVFKGDNKDKNVSAACFYYSHFCEVCVIYTVTNG